jgi:hypothetical protein
MADYITSANFKTRFANTVATNDTRIAAHITAASLEVDSMCGRQFGQHSGAATARYFRPDNCFRVRIDDAYEITAVAVDDADTGAYGTTWATTDYQTIPINGTGINSQTGWPATVLEAIGGYTFPLLRRPSVKVTAKWGWAATPVDVVEATYLLAHRLFFEVSVPGGVTAPNLEFGVPGVALQRPYTVERLLHPYVRADRKLGIAG